MSMRFKIPKSWDDITIEQYQEINRLDKSDEIDYLVSLVSIVCHLDVETVESMDLKKLRDLGTSLAFIKTMPDKFVNDFKLNGKKYIVDCNIAHITTGQYIDLNKYIELGIEENMHKILTLFCLPTKRKFLKRVSLKYGKGYDLNELSVELLKTPISVAYPLALFFCKLLEKSMPAIQDSLIQEVEEMKKIIMKEVEKKKPSNKDGRGFRW